DRALRVYGPGTYLRRLLDVLTIFFLTKFTRKPLRFFGLIGSAIFGIGSVITLYLALYRLLGFGSIADRPLLLLGILLMVLGVQSGSIGLLGEIIIFTHAREISESQVAEII
ncbi:MAG: glycosyl transferase family 2, partial [Acidobacteriota bacterium]|nr:glycosyl transferase family 2 [Acidobacteriota bacterium]